MFYCLCKNKFVKLIIFVYIKLEEEWIFFGNVSYFFDGFVVIGV